MKYILSLIVAISIYSCANHNSVKQNYVTHNLHVENSIAELPDSSFFSEIRSMKYHNNKIYFLDTKRADIVIMSNDLRKMKSLNKKGRANNELLMPFSFDVHNDTIHVMDFGTRKIKLFNEEGYINSTSFPHPDVYDERFTITDTSYIMLIRSREEKGLFTEISKDNIEKCNYYGKLEKFNTKLKRRVMNRSILYSNDKYIITSFLALPYIDCYDRVTKERILRADMSNIPFMEKNLDKIKSKVLDENSCIPVVEDIYVLNDDVFILCKDVKDKINSNIIVQLSIKKDLDVKYIFKLPSKNYMSFCVSPTHIITFNSTKNTIDTFLRITK